MATLFQLPKAVPVAAGNSYPLAKLYFYQSGTTTPITTYTTAALGPTHANPVVADTNGVFAPIYVNEAVNSSYRIQLKTSSDVPIYDIDTIPTAFTSSSLTATLIAGLIFPRTDAEVTAGVTPSDYTFPEGDPRRYGAEGDGVTNDTTAVQRAINVASASGGEANLAGRTYLVDTLTVDASGFTIRNGTLTASTSIPASGAILLSLAGGSDTTVNQALLDGIYGPSVKVVRSVVSGSLENVHIDDVKFVGNANAIRGIWMVGFTRGCRITGCYFNGIDGDDICLNGSWSFSITSNHLKGDGTNGTGLSLGRTGNGERDGSAVVNAALITGNEVSYHNIGMRYDFGAGSTITGNTFEQNVADGVRSQSVDGVTFSGNYLETNAANNMRLGGTNGTDFVSGWDITGNYFKNESTAEHILLQGMQGCFIGPNYYSTTGTPQTRHYYINTNIGQYISDCDLYVPDLTSTYFGNVSTEFNASTNRVRFPKGDLTRHTQNGDYTFTALDAVRVTYKASGNAGETWTIPANATVAYPNLTRLRGANFGGGTLTVAITSDTLHFWDTDAAAYPGQAGTGSAIIPNNTYFEILKIDTTTWVITIGHGLT